MYSSASNSPNTRDATLYSNDGNLPLLSLVPPNTKRILDVGCGPGDNARILNQLGYEVVGITISNAEASIAERYCNRVLVIDLENDPLPESIGMFDVLFLSHVLEHFSDPKAVLRKLAPFLLPGGSCLIAVPNMAQWRIRVRLFLGDWTRDNTGPLDRTHLQFWSFKTAGDMLDETPFQLRVIKGANHAFPLQPLRRVFPNLCSRIDNSVGEYLPNLTAGQVLLIANLA